MINFGMENDYGHVAPSNDAQFLERVVKPIVSGIRWL